MRTLGALSIGQSVSRDRFKQLAWLICVVALVRAGTGWLAWQSLAEDPDSYAQLAVSLAEQSTLGFPDDAGRIRPSAYRPPLYPWMLSWLVSDSAVLPWGVFLLQLLLSLILALAVYSVAARLELRWAWIAGVLVTIDPLLTRASQQVMTELLATTLLMVAWWLWLLVWPVQQLTCSRSTARSAMQWLAVALLGIVFGLSILARPTAAPWWALCSAAMVWSGCQCWKRRLVDILLVSCGVIACLAPWTLRNLAEFGKPIWATTHGGYTLLLANNPSLYQHFRNNGPSRDWDAAAFHRAWANRGTVAQTALLDPAYWLSSTEVQTTSGFKVSPLGELADDELAYRVALHTIREDRATFMLGCVYRLGWLWACWPNQLGVTQTWLIGGWYAGFLILSLWGMYRLFFKRQGRLACWQGIGSWIPGLAIILVLCLVHSLFWSNMRMRCPAMPGIYLLALAAIQPRKG
jgi:4-amino-4-deoxy-L-arabinose transferase-like glycosyltransferase